MLIWSKGWLDPGGLRRLLNMTIDIREAVLAEVETKIAAGEELRQRIDRQEQARAALTEAESAVAEARKDALKSGWSEAELKRLNLIPTTRGARTRTTRTTRTSGE